MYYIVQCHLLPSVLKYFKGNTLLSSTLHFKFPLSCREQIHGGIFSLWFKYWPQLSHWEEGAFFAHVIYTRGKNPNSQRWCVFSSARVNAIMYIYIYITLLDINMWGNIVFTLCPMIFSKSKMARKVECHNRKFCFASFPFFLFFSEMWLKVSLFKSTKILVVSDVFFKETHREFHMNRLTMGIQ